jgi:hypothetical protein
VALEDCCRIIPPFKLDHNSPGFGIGTTVFMITVLYERENVDFNLIFPRRLFLAANKRTL